VAELFKNYEINRSPWWEHVWRIVTGSVVVHLLFVTIVLYVPAFREAFNIASLLTGTDYVDRDYKKTVIRDDVTMLDMREKFEYPPGYFQMNTPQALAPVVIPPAPPPAPLPPVAMTRPNPVPQPTPVATPTPGASPATTAASKGNPGQGQGGTPAASPTPIQDVDKEAERLASEKKIEEINEDSINKRPLKDLLARYNERKNKGEIDLSQTVELTIEAELKPGGKLENPRVVQKSGDPRLIEAAKELVSAVSDSNALFFLQDNNNPEIVKRLTITVKLDQSDVTATVSSEVSDELKAKTMAYIYTALLNKGKEKKKGQDEEVIFNSTNITTKGKQIIVNFKMPRPTAETMLKKQLPAT
jgi:hypothetical protein